MAKLTLTDVVSGYASNAALNTNFTAIENALENTLSLDGTLPNTMTADLDLGGKHLLNAGTLYATDAVIGGASVAGSAAAAAASAASALASQNSASASAASAIVSKDSAATSASIVADWTYSGNWNTGVAYKKNNIVYYSVEGNSYICLVNHTSGVFSTDYSSSKWGLLAIKGAAGAGTGDMLKADNLLGLANNATARSNIGVSATVDTLLKADNLSGLANVATARTNLGLTTGTASGNVPLVGTESATTTLAGLVRKSTTAENSAGTGTGVVAAADLPAAIAATRQVIHVTDEKASGTAAGAAVAGSQTRVLNTVAKNNVTGASLASNDITLPAGTYRVNASAPAYYVGRHRLRLFNVTDSAVTLLGTSEYANSIDAPTRSVISGEFTIAASKVFRLVHYTGSPKATDGLGLAANDTFAEVFTSCFIEKIA